MGAKHKGWIEFIHEGQCIVAVVCKGKLTAQRFQRLAEHFAIGAERVDDHNARAGFEVRLESGKRHEKAVGREGVE